MTKVKKMLVHDRNFDIYRNIFLVMEPDDVRLSDKDLSKHYDILDSNAKFNPKTNLLESILGVFMVNPEWYATIYKVPNYVEV